ncbi:MAG: hypothetical protein Q8Q14_03640 [Gemmatimonadales bacterium]|nr:hypothetical protein [Gemmatimonadales bacterium]
MGFEVTQSATLVFEEGHRLHGATVRVSLDMELREYTELLRLARAWEASVADDGDMTPERLDMVVELTERFGERVLIEWDLEKNGEPLPADGSGMARLPAQAALSLFKAWNAAVTGVPPNSDGASENGEPSEAPPAAMDPPSPSPAS